MTLICGQLSFALLRPSLDDLYICARELFPNYCAPLFGRMRSGGKAVVFHCDNLLVVNMVREMATPSVVYVHAVVAPCNTLCSD